MCITLCKSMNIVMLNGKFISIKFFLTIIKCAYIMEEMFYYGVKGGALI